MTDDDDNIWWYRAKPIRAIDGDTVELLVDHGMHIHSTQRVRLQGVDAPELFRGTEEERERGAAAKSFVEDWLSASVNTDDWPLLVHTNKDRQSFNRYVASVWSVELREFLGDAVVAAGHGQYS